MGNTSSKDRHDDTVDFGALSPQGIYTGPQDWNRETVGRLIVERKLAPFYRPLEDYEEEWSDEQVLAARKEPPPVLQQQPNVGGPSSTLPGDFHPPQTPATTHLHRPHSSKSSRAASKEPIRAMSEAKVYRGAVECPICFLYYPQNINYSRCCNQAICTECFVQIKRADPTPTHLESEPACCPYCVRPNFGVVYMPPPWRAGIGSDATGPGRPDMSRFGSGNQSGDVTPTKTGKRRSSFDHTDEAVVTTDQIRPDWEDKLKAVKAAVARRANRRIIMRQVNGRLIPIGVTSGRIQVMEDGEQGNAEEGSGSRSRRRGPPGELGTLLQSMGMGVTGQDLDEILLQEAMRLSLLEHELEQKKQADEKRKKELADAKNGESSSGQNGAGPSATNAATQPSSALQPATTTSSREPSPASKRLSGVPVAPSPLANASAAIALGVGLPQASGSRSASHSRTPSTSTAHSRTGSSANVPPFNTLAAAVNATNVANAVFASGAPSRSSPALPPQDDLPPLPVVVPQADLMEDLLTSTRANNASGAHTPAGTPLIAVEGVTATAPDIPSPPADASPRDTATPTRPMPLPHQSSPADGGLAVHSVSSQSLAETDDMSTEDESASALDYKVLPSTPNLAMADPLIGSESASIAGRSIS